MTPEEYIRIVGVAIRLIGILWFLLFVFPKIIKETRVVNGLRKLRYSIFGMVVVYYFSQIIIAYASFCIAFSCVGSLTTSYVSFISSICSLLVTAIFYFIYHGKYKDTKEHA